MADPDDLDMGLRYSDRERVFWDDFARTHPRPPGQIQEVQANLADEILGSWHHFEHEGNPGHLTRARLEGMDASVRARTQAAGYPAEALTADALQWSYVLQERGSYQQQFVAKHMENSLWSSNFLGRVWVDPRLITGPLTDEQLKAANSWKTAYLQRLRKEGADESYISAYLLAWNLPSEAVFGESK